MVARRPKSGSSGTRGSSFLRTSANAGAIGRVVEHGVDVVEDVPLGDGAFQRGGQGPGPARHADHPSRQTFK